MPFLYVAVLFQRLSRQHYSVTQQFIYKLHLCCAFLRFSIADHICSFPCPRCSMPLRLRTVLFLYQAFLFYCQSSPYCSCAYPLCTFPQQFGSVLLHAYALHFLAMPARFLANPGHSLPMPNLTFPLQCISFLFHCRSWLINAVTSLCSALLNVTLPSHSNAIPMRFKANLFLRIANQCHYLKIVAGLWLISCQTKAPLPELRHCPRPLNRP